MARRALGPARKLCRGASRASARRRRSCESSGEKKATGLTGGGTSGAAGQDSRESRAGRSVKPAVLQRRHRAATAVQPAGRWRELRWGTAARAPYISVSWGRRAGVASWTRREVRAPAIEPSS
eukprot:scaffold2560_cov397-Prasinococcus_capsulatus_cf.AAC.4